MNKDSAGWVSYSSAGPTVVDALGRWAPEAVLVPLAVDRERGWMLSPDGGRTLREVAWRPDPAHWEQLLPFYAQLQRRLVPKADELVALGVPDLRPVRLPGRLGELLGGELLGGELLGGELLGADRRLSRFMEWCAELEASGIDPSIQHDDLHDANVFPHEHGYRISDWGDASVGHPFGTLLGTLRILKRRLELPAGDPVLERLRDAYLEPWTDEHDRPSLVRAFELAIRVALVGRALAEQRALVGADVAARDQYAGVVDGWLGVLFEPHVL